MLLILDSNQYIFAFGSRVKLSCVDLLNTLPDLSSISLRIPRLVAEEVRVNLTPEAFKEFIRFIHILTTIDEDTVVPFETAFKYESEGLKPADSFIAAYAEWTGADILVSENRHFLTRHANLPFKVLSAKNCLNLI